MADPLLEPRDGFVVPPLDFCLNVVSTELRRGCPARPGEGRGTRRGAFEEGAAVHRVIHIASV
ncbi:MAG: hypothetical protein DMD70_00530 [Gemmatimonadetes bacterium]|nr:MAG: hypothetical protein DMD70_00530 [Gemmatimonadota bacterium]